MIIKDKNQKNLFLIRFLKRKIILFFILFVLAFLSGAIAHKKGYLENSKTYIAHSMDVFENFFRGQFYSGNTDVIHIDIKFKHFKKIVEQRNKALKNNVLISEGYVPATINFKGSIYKIKIRLKGDLLDHLKGEKWSFRVKLKGEKTLFGMKVFSLQHPKTRNFIWEPFFHQTLKKENIVALRSDFVNVVINGKDYGLYNIEEHFDKRLLEDNQRKEGPIIKFNESSKWAKELQFAKYNAYSQSQIDAFQTESYLLDSLKHLQYTKATTLLEGLRTNVFSQSKAVDVNLMTKYLAICDLFGGHHGLTWHNRRFYYNPITNLLEPVAYDSNSGNRIEELYLSSYLDNFNTLFRDDIFFTKKYIEYLDMVSQPVYVDHLYEDFQKNALENKLNQIYSEFPYYFFDKEILYQNQRIIRDYIYPFQTLNSYLIASKEGKLKLNIGNLSRFPVEISAVHLSGKDSIVFEKPLLIKGKKSMDAIVEYKEYIFDLPSNFSFSDSIPQISIVNKIIGTSKTNKVAVYPWNNFNKSLTEDVGVQNISDLKKLDFIEIDSLQKKIDFKNDNISISETLYLPRGFQVVVHEGTQIDLLNKASIISNSALYFFGTHEKPISLISSDHTGQGLFVKGVKETSVFNYVHVENQSCLAKKSWNLSGALTFYDTNVSFSNCILSNNLKGDDYLNMVRSHFKIENTFLRNTKADALDSDFSNGTLKNCTFINCGNDGIDTSGSIISMENIRIEGAKDKAISSGEKSDLTIQNLEVLDSEIAVCSKDLSNFTIQNAVLTNNRIGFTAFQKKSEFGAGSIICNNAKLSKIELLHLVEKGSRLLLNGDEITESGKDVKSLLYGVKYGKSSK